MLDYGKDYWILITSIFSVSVGVFGILIAAYIMYVRLESKSSQSIKCLSILLYSPEFRVHQNRIVSQVYDPYDFVGIDFFFLLAKEMSYL